MGRGRGRGRGGGGGWGRGGGRKQGDDYVTEKEKDNPDFNEYYQAQGIVPEGEWDAFLNSLRKPLPVTFRINGSGQFADHLRDKLQTDFFSHFGDGTLMVEGEAVPPPRPLSWYPNNYAWQTDFSRGQLRKIPLLDQIHEFIKRSNELGSISRQEAVSMVPPLFLGVRPTDRVLDMCAAPGSKTFQLLEALHSATDASLPSTTTASASQASAASASLTGPPMTDILPQGFVIANDSDYQRCNLLTHQIKRVNSPCLMVTNQSAEVFPMLKDAAGKELRFTRILCDVPCSGDGTMRKAPDIWRRWSCMNGNQLHMLQLRIALHGIRLLEVGGRMVYSTCTFNPIEDEAVVAALLQHAGPAVRLCDVSDQLPQLKRLPGMKQWRVRDRNRWYESWTEAKDVSHKLEPSMFSTPEVQALPLECCMRFLPHHQDTGGFFVAVLEKVAELPTDFTLPLPYRGTPEFARAARAAVCVQAGEGTATGSDLDPLAAARVAAQDALVAATNAIDALQKGDVDAATDARKAARRAANEVGKAVSAARSAAQKRAKQGEAAAAGSIRSGQLNATQTQTQQVEDKNEDEEMDAAAGEGQGEGVVVGEGDGEGVAMSVDGEGDGEGKAAAEGEGDAPGAALITTSWVRGGGSRGRVGKGGQIRYVDPIVPVEDTAMLQAVREYYGLLPNFPLEQQLIARTLETSRPKRLYFLSEPILHTLLSDTSEQLRVIAAGLKIFERQEIREFEGVEGTGAASKQCGYRIAQEGIPYLLPFVTRQRLSLSVSDFLTLLKERSLLLPLEACFTSSATNTTKTDVTAADVPTAATPAAAADAPAAGTGADGSTAAGTAEPGRKIREKVSDTATLEQLRSIRYGCTICELRTADAVALGLPTGIERADGLMAHAPMALSAWRGKSSIALMVDKMEAAQMADKIVSCYVKMEAAQMADKTVSCYGIKPGA